MKKIKLNSEEKELLNSFENEEWVPVDRPKHERAELQKAARNTLRKDRRINIRLSSKDLSDIQTVAAQEGIPYQTLISSIIHKYANGGLIDRNQILMAQEDSAEYKTRQKGE